VVHALIRAANPRKDLGPREAVGEHYRGRHLSFVSRAERQTGRQNYLTLSFNGETMCGSGHGKGNLQELVRCTGAVTSLNDEGSKGKEITRILGRFKKNARHEQQDRLIQHNREQIVEKLAHLRRPAAKVRDIP